MAFLHAFVFGIVEGVTEFLPVSSTGHLLLTARLFDLEQTPFLRTFEVVIQLGAMLSVLTLYGSALRKRRTCMLIVCGFIPTGILGLLLHRVIKDVLFQSPLTVLIALFAGGILLIAFELLHPKNREACSLTPMRATIIGIFQAAALVPGVSRSAATIIGGMLLGVERRTIIEYSFLLALPTIASASAFDLLGSSSGFSLREWGLLAAGFITSWGAATLAIRWFVAYLARHSFMLFGLYRILLATFLFFLIRP